MQISGTFILFLSGCCNHMQPFSMAKFHNKLIPFTGNRLHNRSVTLNFLAVLLSQYYICKPSRRDNLVARMDIQRVSHIYGGNHSNIIKHFVLPHFCLFPADFAWKLIIWSHLHEIERQPLLAPHQAPVLHKIHKNWCIVFCSPGIGLCLIPDISLYGISHYRVHHPVPYCRRDFVQVPFRSHFVGRITPVYPVVDGILAHHLLPYP